MMSLLFWYLTTVVSTAQKNQFIRLLFSVGGKTNNPTVLQFCSTSLKPQGDFFLCQLTCARDLLSVLFLALPVIFFCHLVFSKMSSISISPFVFPSKHRHWTKVNLANELNLLHLVIQSPLLSLQW